MKLIDPKKSHISDSVDETATRYVLDGAVEIDETLTEQASIAIRRQSEEDGSDDNALVPLLTHQNTTTATVTIMRLEDAVTKRFPCGYCETEQLVTKPQRHFRRYHSKDVLIAESIKKIRKEQDVLTTIPEKEELKRERLALENLILNTSTYNHNKRVIKDRKGVLCPVRLPSVETLVQPSDYQFCNRCNGLYRRGKHLKDHIINHCSQRVPDPDENMKAVVTSKAKRICVNVKPDSEVGDELMNMISVMRSDDFTAIVKEDGLILYIGQLYLDRNGPESSCEHIRQSMRLLAKVVDVLGVPSLSDAIQPSRFKQLCNVVRSNFPASSRQKLGIYLKSAVEHLQNIAIEKKNAKLSATMEWSLKLFAGQWKHRVGYQARLQMQQYGYNKVNILPISRDVLKIRTHLDQEVSTCLDDYQNKTGDPVRTKKILACKSTVFNKRRGMEFVKATKQDVIHALAQQNENPRHAVEELQDCLSPIEQKLTACMKLIRLKGKQGMAAPVLLEQKDFDLLKCLIDDPSCHDDKYLFQNQMNKPYRGHVILGNIADGLSLEKPDAIRATALRKYMATVIQVMALPDYQMKWVAQHLGHSTAVHDQYYKQPLDSVEVAKISKLMYLVDNCHMHSVKGKDLDSIDTFLDASEDFNATLPNDNVDEVLICFLSFPIIT